MGTNIIGSALVTGASRGIGRAIALRLAQDGYAVVCNYAQDVQGAADVVDTIAAAGGEAVKVRADVSDSEQVKFLFDNALDRFGTLDVVVCNAAAMTPSPIVDWDHEKFDLTIATNLRGAFLVLGQAAQHVQSGGRIIAMSSSMIAKAFPSYGAYIASKAGIEGLVRVLANELRGRAITVNAIAPGPIATEAMVASKSQSEIDFLARASPLERLGEPDEVASVASFLVGPNGGWVNGQVLRVNGGFA